MFKLSIESDHLHRNNTPEATTTHSGIQQRQLSSSAPPPPPLSPHHTLCVRKDSIGSGQPRLEFSTKHFMCLLSPLSFLEIRLRAPHPEQPQQTTGSDPRDDSDCCKKNNDRDHHRRHGLVYYLFRDRCIERQGDYPLSFRLMVPTSFVVQRFRNVFFFPLYGKDHINRRASGGTDHKEGELEEYRRSVTALEDRNCPNFELLEHLMDQEAERRRRFHFHKEDEEERARKMQTDDHFQKIADYYRNGGTTTSSSSSVHNNKNDHDEDPDGDCMFLPLVSLPTTKPSTASSSDPRHQTTQKNISDLVRTVKQFFSSASKSNHHHHHGTDHHVFHLNDPVRPLPFESMIVEVVLVTSRKYARAALSTPTNSKKEMMMMMATKLPTATSNCNDEHSDEKGGGGDDEFVALRIPILERNGYREATQFSNQSRTRNSTSQGGPADEQRKRRRSEDDYVRGNWKEEGAMDKQAQEPQSRKDVLQTCCSPLPPNNGSSSLLEEDTKKKKTVAPVGGGRVMVMISSSSSCKDPSAQRSSAVTMEMTPHMYQVIQHTKGWFNCLRKYQKKADDAGDQRGAGLSDNDNDKKCIGPNRDDRPIDGRGNEKKDTNLERTDDITCPPESDEAMIPDVLKRQPGFLPFRVKEAHDAADITKSETLMFDWVPPTVADFRKRYVKICKIGEGTFGDVFLAHDTVRNASVTIKRTKKLFSGGNKSGGSGERRMALGLHTPVLRESTILRNLKHPNIVQLLDVVYLDDGSCNFIFPVISHDLESVLACASRRRSSLRQRKRLPVEMVKCIFQQLMKAIAFLHDHNIIHRDLKMNNIMIHKNGRVQIIDFGWARYCPPPISMLDAMKHRECHNGGSDKNEGNRHVEKRKFSAEEEEFLGAYMTGPVCAMGYRAPEILIGGGMEKYYTTKIDIWSCGCILFELLTATSFIDKKLAEKNHNARAGSASPRHQEQKYCVTDMDAMVQLVHLLGSPPPADPRYNSFGHHVLAGRTSNRTSGTMLKFEPRKRPHIREVLDRAGVSDDAQDLLTRILTWTPEMRFNAKEILEHSWFTSSPLPSSPSELELPPDNSYRYVERAARKAGS